MIYDQNPLSQAFRDANTAARHLTQNWDINAAAHDRVVIGLPIDTRRSTPRSPVETGSKPLTLRQFEDARLRRALVRFSIVVDWRRVPTFTALVPIGLAQPGRNRSGAIIAQNA